MKNLFLCAFALSLCGSLASAQPPEGQPAPPPKTEAQLIVEKCRAAYGNLKTYRGTTKTNSVSIINGAENNYGASATFLFSKPDMMRIDGKLAMGGGDFSIFSVPEGTWYRWPFENGGKWKKAADYSEAVSKMTGVAATAPTTIAYLLFAPQQAPTFARDNLAKMDGEEKIDGADCFKITVPTATETTSWWIDKKSFLLRRIVASYDEAQAAAMAAQLKKEMAKVAMPPGMPEMEFRQVSRTEEFQIEAIDEPVDEKLFAGPDVK